MPREPVGRGRRIARTGAPTRIVQQFCLLRHISLQASDAIQVFGPLVIPKSDRTTRIYTGCQRTSASGRACPAPSCTLPSCLLSLGQDRPRARCRCRSFPHLSQRGMEQLHPLWEHQDHHRRPMRAVLLFSPAFALQELQGLARVIFRLRPTPTQYPRTAEHDIRASALHTCV